MTARRVLRLGTRGSRLALTQTGHAADLLRAAHPDLDVETIIIQTTGDKILDSPLARIGGKGLFTKEIEQALLDGRIDAAVHSLKDLPTQQPAGLTLGAVSKREAPHDVLISREPVDWKALGEGDRIGTSSLRRRAQVRRLNQRVGLEELRGNVPTRIRKVIEGEYTAILLAAAGVTRLAADAPCAAPVLFEDMLPAPGQGALGVQIRESDGAIRELLRPLHDADAAACCEAERAVLQGLGGGCQLPLGTLAVIEGGVLLLRARVVSVDGRCACEAEVEGSPAEAAALGMRCVGKLLARGAAEILATLTLADPDAGYEEAVRSAREMAAGPLGGKRVLITRDEDADGPLSVALRALGADPLCLPLIRHVPPEDPEPLEAAARAIAEFDWIVFTSARAVDVLSAKIGGGAPLSAVRASIACVGPATARRVEHHGGHASWVSAGASAESLLRDLQAVGLCADQRVLFPRADKARETMAPGLRRLGAKLTEVIAYRTVPGGESRSVLEALRGGTVDAVLFCSPSAVEGLCETLGAGEARGVLAGLLVGSIGPTTTEALRQAGIEPGVEAADRSFEGLVRGLVKHLQGAEER